MVMMVKEISDGFGGLDGIIGKDEEEQSRAEIDSRLLIGRLFSPLIGSDGKDGIDGKEKI